ncbi:MAG: hypothetical protein WC933_03290 [Candidatus Paceibacterota bacterium]|jgi:hypothetical protein
MTIHCLFVQKNCLYPGQYAPELYAASDEVCDDENPGYMNEMIKEVEKEIEINMISFYKVIDIEIDQKKFDELFFSNPSLKGTLKS